MDSPERIATVEELRKAFAPLANANVIHRGKLTALDKLALFATEKIGTMGFFFLIAGFNFTWIAWNILAPKDLVFDPAFSFLILLFINNILQILFMPLIMIGQNLQGRHAQLRAENDFETNRKAEKEIEVMLLRLENQEKLIHKILEKIEDLTHRR